MDKWTHTTLFDRPYPPEKRAEGLAISEAIVGGHCDECVFLANCITQRTFKFPATAWCMKRKSKILKKWHGEIVTIKANGQSWQSVLTGYEKTQNTHKFVFGYVRVDLDKILRIERRARA